MGHGGARPTLTLGCSSFDRPSPLETGRAGKRSPRPRGSTLSRRGDRAQRATFRSPLHFWAGLKPRSYDRLHAEDEGAGGGEGAAGAVDAGELRVRDLAVAALAAELADGFDEEEDAVHAGVGVGEAAAVGVEGEVAAGGGALAGDEGAAFAGLAEAERLQGDEGGVGEGVVDFDDVDVLVADAGHLEGEGTGD